MTYTRVRLGKQVSRINFQDPSSISLFDTRRNFIPQGQVMEVIYLHERAFKKTELGLW